MRAIHTGVLPLVLALAACGSWAAETDDTGQRVPVRVQNDLTNRSDVTIRLLSNDGASRVLGGAPPGGDQLFEYRDAVLSGTYRLTARTSDGRTIESRPFTLFPGAAVIWRLQRNDLQVITADFMSGPDPVSGDARIALADRRPGVWP